VIDAARVCALYGYKDLLALWKDADPESKLDVFCCHGQATISFLRLTSHMTSTYD
jgi:hypothetical protein